MKEDLEVLYEDNHVIVVVKPQFVPSQADSSGDEDMLTIVKTYIKEKYNKTGNVYLGLVHRLDRPTGGIMVFAKSSKAAERLSSQFASDEVHKIYLAVVKGVPKEKHGRLTHYLKKDEKENKVMVVPQSTTDAKKAELDYEVLETKSGYSLVRVNLITGRSHQIRVQLKTIGTPIFGDNKYDEDAVKAKLNLYAVCLMFEHPTTKSKMRFIVYPPEKESMWNLFNLEKYLQIKQEY